MTSKRGAKSKYDEKRHPRLIKSYARKGLTNEEISKKFRIHRSTLNEWLKLYPELSDAHAEGRDYAIAVIEESTFKAATGYEIEEKKLIGKPETVRDDDGREREVIKTVRVEQTKRHIPPNQGAAKILLNAWAPDVYKDRMEHSGRDGGPIELTWKDIVQDVTGK